MKNSSCITYAIIVLHLNSCNSQGKSNSKFSSCTSEGVHAEGVPLDENMITKHMWNKTCMITRINSYSKTCIRSTRDLQLNAANSTNLSNLWGQSLITHLLTATVRISVTRETSGAASSGRRCAEKHLIDVWWYFHFDRLIHRKFHPIAHRKIRPNPMEW